MSENFWKYTVAMIVVVFVIWLLYMYMSPVSNSDDSSMKQHVSTSHQTGQTGQVCPLNSPRDDCTLSTNTSNINFDKFVMNIRNEAKQMGFKEPVISNALNNVKLYHDISLPKSLTKDYDNLRSMSDIMLFISDGDIKNIRDQYQHFQSLINRIGKKLNIDPKILGVTYLLKLEKYKNNPPTRTVFDVLMSMLYKYPDSKVVRHELFTAIILVSDGLNASQMLAMNDGSMGVIRFFPSEYLHYTTSRQKNIMPNIWDDPYDSILSLGRFLLKHGLKADYNNQDHVFMMKVNVPDNKQHFLSNIRSGNAMHRCLPDSVQITDKQTLSTWYSLGLTRVDGKSISAPNQNKFYLLRDTSVNSRDHGFLVDDNYFTMLDYSCSHKFTLRVFSVINRLQAE